MAIVQATDDELMNDAAERQYERNIYIQEQAKKRDHEYALAKLAAEREVAIAKANAGAGQAQRALLRLFSLPVLLVCAITVFFLTLFGKESESLNKFLAS